MSDAQAKDSLAAGGVSARYNLNENTRGLSPLEWDMRVMSEPDFCKKYLLSREAYLVLLNKE